MAGVAVILVVLAGLALWRKHGPVKVASVPCAQQQPANLSPQCAAQAQTAAGGGDRAAMMVLAQYFQSRQPAEALRWVRAAAAAGEPRAIHRVLHACGAGQPFTLAEAQELVARAPLLEALDFQLGGSCAPLDLAAARAVQPAAVLAEADGAGLCKVAVRYGLLRMSREGAQLDSQAAQQMLAECERRAQAPADVRMEAEAVRQMLAREIKPVHISVD